MSQETMTMERVYEKLEAVSDNVDSMATSVKQIENKQITMDMHVSSIMTPPTLETRLKSYVDDAVSRNHASFMQALGNAQTIIQQGQRIAQLEMQSQIKDVASSAAQVERDRTQNHAENQSHGITTDNRLKVIERNMYMLIGALAIIQVIIKFAFK